MADSGEVKSANFRSFEESTKADWDIIIGRIGETQAMVPENIVHQLKLLSDDEAGYPVTRLEHCLQTATRAERDGRDEEYVLCALLHDIGDALSPYNHEQIAAAILKPFVSEANHFMVAHHGIFQGFYFWHHIGMDKDARLAYRSSPYFEYTVEFCAKYDGISFDKDYRSEPLEHYVPLINSFFGSRDFAAAQQ
jgi:predicted HD phosphohydrolase